jgi:hypothetical protein
VAGRPDQNDSLSTSESVPLQSPDSGLHVTRPLPSPPGVLFFHRSRLEGYFLN